MSVRSRRKGVGQAWRTAGAERSTIWSAAFGIVENVLDSTPRTLRFIAVVAALGVAAWALSIHFDFGFISMGR